MKHCPVRRSVSTILSAVMLIGSPVLASEAVEIRSTDYQLGQKGVIAGQVINQSGQPVAGLPVQVLHEDRVIAAALSDEDGHFGVEGLRNGQHSVRLGASQQSVRFWANSTAPPTAQTRMEIIVDEKVVRSQCADDLCGDGIVRGQGGPGWGTTVGILIIGGAVATTLALTLNNKKSSDVVASP